MKKDEIKVLKYLNTVKSSDDQKVADACELTSTKEAEKILDHLKGFGLVKGTKANNTGWVIVMITPEGRQVVRDKNKTWLKKINWSIWIPIIISIIALIIAWHK